MGFSFIFLEGYWDMTSNRNVHICSPYETCGVRSQLRVLKEMLEACFVEYGHRDSFEETAAMLISYYARYAKPARISELKTDPRFLGSPLASGLTKNQKERLLQPGKKQEDVFVSYIPEFSEFDELVDSGQRVYTVDFSEKTIEMFNVLDTSPIPGTDEPLEVMSEVPYDEKERLTDSAVVVPFNELDEFHQKIRNIERGEGGVITIMTSDRVAVEAVIHKNKE